MVGGGVRGGVDGRELVLRGSRLVVLGLGVNAELPELEVQLAHKLHNSRAYRAEVVVFKLLPLRRHRAEKRSAGEFQILAFVGERLVDEEVFLLGADVGRDALRVRAEKPEHAQRLRVDKLHRAKQGSFLIQHLAAVRAERGRDAERIVLQKRV